MKKTTAQPLRGIGKRALPAAMAALLALTMAPALAPQAATAAEAPEAQAQELVLSDGYAYRHSIAGFCDWLLESGKMGSDSYRLLLQDVENAKAGRADLRTAERASSPSWRRPIWARWRTRPSWPTWRAPSSS